MFDSLQEGIVVLSDDQIDFMNDFSSKFIRYIHGMDKETTKAIDMGQSKTNILNKKIFFLFENDKEKQNIKGYQKKKKNSIQSAVGIS